MEDILNGGVEETVESYDTFDDTETVDVDSIDDGVEEIEDTDGGSDEPAVEEPAKADVQAPNYEDMYNKLYNELQSKLGQNQTQENKAPEMTEAMAQQIFQNEIEQGVHPQTAIQHLIQNTQLAQTSSFQKQYGSILNEQMLNQEINKLSSKYTDFNEYKDGLKEKVMNEIDKEYVDDRLSDKAAFEMAYLRAKTEALQKKLDEAFTNGKKQAQEDAKTLKNTKTAKVGAKQVSKGSDTLSGINIVETGDGIFL